jgi:hypothetical protein
MVSKLTWRTEQFFLPFVETCLFLMTVIAFSLVSCQGASDVPDLYDQQERAGAGADQVLQSVSWGDWRQERLGAGNLPFANTGLQIYLIGDVDGGFRPRSNVYDLYTFGEPLGNDPLANELQGVWAQPVKALDGYQFVVEVNGESYALNSASQFTQTFTTVKFEFDLPEAGLNGVRTDFAAQNQPILFTKLSLHNISASDIEVKLDFFAHFDLEDAWFTSLADKRNKGETVEIIDDRLVAHARSAPDKWAVAVGSDPLPDQLQVVKVKENQKVGQMTFTTSLEPGERMAWSFAVVVESESGAEQALGSLDNWMPERARFLIEKQQLYDSIAVDGPHLISPDKGLNRAFDIARANMQMLEAESPALGQYFYAGLEMFPFWFSNDGAYSLLGLLANDQYEAARNHLLIGTRFHQDGSIPHQISPAGDLVGVGNAQETSQWVSGVWDYYLWTGDREFLKSAYPTAVAGILHYTMEEIDQDDDGYPEGPAMVEREGMGPEKVDATSYLWLALNDLALMAEELNDFETAERARQESSNLQASFTADWWLPEEKLYANSLLQPSNTPRNDGHWTVAVPLEVGIAPPEQARLSLERIQSDYLNEWGLVHTLDDDERVWTLPTAVLSQGAYNYGDAELGFAMLQNIAKTLDHGGIGLFHELIPDGLSFFQLWSGATYIRGIVEDLLGIAVRSDRHEMIIAPQLPGSWESAGLQQLRFGEHTVSIMATPNDITVTHDLGQVPLSIAYQDQEGAEIHFNLEPGEEHNASISE